ncbi:MAG: PASTA domain-containing protein [Actinobacteria bacterium]|nr:PASTA domain-containing protein [Actinomycetota bacterium]MCL5887847.1 PASTA domain-containing protein [Actinomycetota bacterium]
MIERDRPVRPPLIPKQVYIAVGILAVIAIVTVAAVVVSTQLERVVVPDVVGVSEGEAEARLALLELQAVVGEQVFDPAPVGTVLSQEPTAGVSVTPGTAVTLRLSAGIEEFTMPDVFGFSLPVARAQLEGRGLTIIEEQVPSDAPMDTVLSTIPSPGATVRTGDFVRVQIAAAPEDVSALLPLDLTGHVIAIDPAPIQVPLPASAAASPTAAVTDPTLEVARRVGSLLEAAGARVIITRSMVMQDASPPVRSAVVTGTISAIIGLDLTTRAEEPGVHIRAVNRVSAPGTYDSAIALARGVGIAFTEDGKANVQGEIPGDPVTTAVSAPAMRITLGSLAVAEDAVMFADPAWADSIARTLYRGVGEWLTVPGRGL